MSTRSDGSHPKTDPRRRMAAEWTSPTPGVAIVGCGLVGQKRAAALGRARLVACADIERDRAEALARTAHRAVATNDWRSVVTRADVDVVIVATTNDALATV